MKDRTEMFDGRPEFVITSATGKMIKDWCELGIEPEKYKAPISDNAFSQAVSRIKEGETSLVDKIKQTFIITESQLEALDNAVAEAIASDKKLK